MRRPADDLPASIPEEVAIWGEVPFAEAAAQAIGRALIWPDDDWLPGLPEHYRRREVALCTLAEARARSAPAFVKPARGRAFAAKLYHSGAELPDAPLDTPTLVAEPVTWRGEVRCFVADRQVCALSAYRGRPSLVAAQRFVRDLLTDRTVALPRAATIDVGQIAGRGWAIVEANPAWASAIYGCEPRGVLTALTLR